jgi:hypothetical protein
MYKLIVELIKHTKVDGLTKSLKAKPEYWEAIQTWNKSWPTKNGSEQIYLYLHQMQKPTCICGSGKYLGFKSFNLGYNEFCSSSCEPAKKIATERRVASLIQSGGVGLANPKIKAKARATLEEKGIINPGQLEQHRLNMLSNNPMGTEIGQASYRKTMFERYGVENPAQRHFSEECRDILNDDEKFKTYLEKLGIMGLAQYLNIGWNVISQKGKELGIVNPDKSKYEGEIARFLVANNILFKQRDRTIIRPKELDFFIDDAKLAIEFCGLFYHTENGGQKTRSYHIDKFKNCLDQNIQLLTIFEDEWVNKPTVWKNKILILNKKLNMNRIHARKCQIAEINGKIALPFLDAYHLQGSTPAKIYIGAFFNTVLVSVMTFSLGRDNKSLELNRFCSLDTCIIPGIASKLFSFFIKEYSPTKIISFSDNRYSSGNVYPILGFTKEKELPADYSYVQSQSNRRYHKFAFSKSKILKNHKFDSTMTEWEMMQALGYDRIWDCGKIKWVWEP